MRKNTEIKFVGQPILKQNNSLIEKADSASIIKGYVIDYC